jgi:hypothetical protein
LIGMPPLEAGFDPVVDVTLAGDVVRRHAVIGKPISTDNGNSNGDEISRVNIYRRPPVLSVACLRFADVAMRATSPQVV